MQFGKKLGKFSSYPIFLRHPGDSDFRKLSILLIVTWFPFPIWFSLSSSLRDFRRIWWGLFRGSEDFVATTKLAGCHHLRCWGIWCHHGLLGHWDGLGHSEHRIQVPVNKLVTRPHRKRQGFLQGLTIFVCVKHIHQDNLHQHEMSNCGI